MSVGIAHQYKIRVEKEKEGSNSLFGEYWKELDLELKNSVVKRVTRDVARPIILEYEWLGTMSQTSHHYGIFFGDVCGGVVCYGNNCTANPNICKEFAISPAEIWILARGACVHWTPKGSASKLIADSLKIFHQEVPECKVVMAYSDVEAGEIGTVYQATNWLYIGLGVRLTVNYFNAIAGRRFDERQLHELKKSMGISRPEVRKRLLAEGWVKQPKAIKHKYIFLLGSRKDKKELLDKIEVLPYPKREDNKPIYESQDKTRNALKKKLGLVKHKASGEGSIKRDTLGIRQEG